MTSFDEMYVYVTSSDRLLEQLGDFSDKNVIEDVVAVYGPVAQDFCDLMRAHGCSWQDHIRCLLHMAREAHPDGLIRLFYMRWSQYVELLRKELSTGTDDEATERLSVSTDAIDHEGNSESSEDEPGLAAFETTGDADYAGSELMDLFTSAWHWSSSDSCSSLRSLRPQFVWWVMSWDRPLINLQVASVKCAKKSPIFVLMAKPMIAFAAIDIVSPAGTVASVDSQRQLLPMNDTPGPDPQMYAYEHLEDARSASDLALEIHELEALSAAGREPWPCSGRGIFMHWGPGNCGLWGAGGSSPCRSCVVLRAVAAVSVGLLVKIILSGDGPITSRVRTLR